MLRHAVATVAMAVAVDSRTKDECMGFLQTACREFRSTLMAAGYATTTRGWAASDFVNGNAPVSLDGVIVAVDGKQAFVNYVSPNQVNVQVPAGISTSGTVPVLVNFKNQTSAVVKVNVSPLSPGLLAPASFKAGDKQYVAA